MCIIVLNVQLRVEYDNAFTADINKLFVGSLVVLSFPVVKGVADIINSYSINPLHDGVELLLLLLVLKQNMIIL